MNLIPFLKKNTHKSRAGKVELVAYAIGRVGIRISYKHDDMMLFHDHHWDYFTLILWGGYREWIIWNPNSLSKDKPTVIWWKDFVRRPGWFTYRKHDVYHRIRPLGNISVSFFIHGKLQKKLNNFVHQNRVMTVPEIMKADGKPRAEIVEYLKDQANW